jgi:hypothetical protein
MRLFTVKLDDKAIPPVVAVPETACPAGLCERHLVVSGGQTVGTFHIPVVTKFEDRMRAPRRCRNHLTELGSPAQPFARPRRHAQCPIAGKPTNESAGYPPADIIELNCRIHEIDDCVFDGSAGQHRRRKLDRANVDRDVNQQATDRLDPSAMRDRHVNNRSPAVRESVQLRRGLVTEFGTGPGIEDGGPQFRLAVQRPGERRVHATVNLPPSSESELRHDRARR